MNLPAPQFQAIQEQDDFLALFAHRFDYIWADHPDPGQRPDWKTERRHLLSDRLIQQGAYLYGVRFGKQTRYLMLDLDAKSRYHPAHQPAAVKRIIEALEPLDLVSWVAVRSSESGGIHLYFPFEEAQDTSAIAQAASILLESAGFKLVPGQLEVFPNPRPYSKKPSLYQAHRLPMQTGSYLLDDDFQPILGTQATFVHHWNHAQHRNLLTQATIKRVLKRLKSKQYRLSTKATKFLNDLNAEVEPGWTGSGQTNHLLGRITMREYIFGHIQRRCAPLADEALVATICEVARSLPSFSDYCNHQHDLEDRVTSYVRSIQSSRYYPYGSKTMPKPLPDEPAEPAEPTWNERQSLGARDRIIRAVTDLLEKNILPSQLTARKKAVKAYGIGNTTLDKYPELWHPAYLNPLQDAENHPIDAIEPDFESLKPLQDEENHAVNTNKLGSLFAAPPGQANEPSTLGGCGGGATADRHSVVAEKKLAKMQSWLESGDPILTAEAEQFFASVSLADAGMTPVQDHDWQRLPSDLTEGVAMSKGFGAAKSKQSSKTKTETKTKTKTELHSSAVQRLDVKAKLPTMAALSDAAAIQAEADAFFAQYQQEHPLDLALAWEAGVDNPLAGVDLLAVGARFFEGAEEDWLAIARMVEWLDVEDDMDAVYYTAPPPDFALERADWYVCPAPISFLEEPVLLREVIHRYPIPLEEIQSAIADRFLRLGWHSLRQEQFILEMFEKPLTELAEHDWDFLLFELESQVQESDRQDD